jgi:hypothetical protein
MYAISNEVEPIQEERNPHACLVLTVISFNLFLFVSLFKDFFVTL